MKSACMKLPQGLLSELLPFLLPSSVSGHTPASAAVSPRQDHDSPEWSVTLILGQRPAQGVQCITQESLRWTYGRDTCSLRVQISSIQAVRPSINVAGIGVSMHPVLQRDNSTHLSRAILAHNWM